jgi:uncharacterized protein (DUF58 family)
VKPSSRARPEHWKSIVFGGSALVVLFAGVAHASGSVWVEMIGALVAGLALPGIVLPVFVLYRLQPACSSSPSDAVAREPFEVQLSSSRPLRVSALEPAGPPLFLPGGVLGALEVTASHRGVLDALRCEVGTAAPFGLLWWSREVVIPLPRPCYVAPQMAPSRDASRARVSDPGTESALRPGRRPGQAGGELRSVRRYEPGDGQRSVHWPASAHTGQLMVRELETTDDALVTIELSLPSDRDESEVRAGEYLATMTTLLDQGRHIRCVSIEAPRADDPSDPGKAGSGRTESGHLVVGDIYDPLQAGRRLAAAVAWPTAGEHHGAGHG